MSAVLLLEDRGVVVHRVRAVDRIAARVHSLDLDRRLAAGAPPESSAALSLRAALLLRPVERRRMARGLRGLISHVQRRPSLPAGAPVARKQVLEAAPLIERLADRLVAIEPVDVRGVALARLLITDGAGPLYSGHRRRAVAEAVARALDAVPAV